MNLIDFTHKDDRSVRDCELFCRIVFGEHDVAHKTIPVPFRPVELPSKLKFGYYFSGKLFPTFRYTELMMILHTKDTMVRSSPANVRAVQETINALRSQGHECVEFVPSLSMFTLFGILRLAHDVGRVGRDAMSAFVALTTADGYKRMLSTLESDPAVRVTL